MRQGTVLRSSWYGLKEEGRRTASGVIFHRDDSICASRTYSFGTTLVLINPVKPSLGIVVCEVLDRGPFIKGRSLDLSESLATRLGFHEQGVALLKVLAIRRLNRVDQRKFLVLDQPTPEGSHDRQLLEQSAESNAVVDAPVSVVSNFSYGELF